MGSKTGIELIAQKRKEQVEKHGRSVESDILNNPGKELAWAASTLISPFKPSGREKFASMPIDWSGLETLEMCRKPYKDRLIIAGALIAAELDRLQLIEKEGLDEH